MATLVVLASGVVTFFAAFGLMAVLVMLCERLGGRWGQKLINPVCPVLLFLLLGTPAYTMAAFGGLTLFAALWCHIGAGVLFGLFALCRIQNYVESFVAALMLCTLLSSLIPAVSAARDAARRKQDVRALQPSNPARPQSGSPLGSPAPGTWQDN